VGLCPQYQNLDTNLLLRQNLVFQGKYYGLDKRELENRIDYLLDRFELDMYRNSKIEVLSGGYKQRFLIAKSLIHSPKILILDEPTVGLDPQVRHKLWDFIKVLKKEGMTVILTTHYLDEAEELSDRVCVIDQGKIKTVDSPENLKINFMKDRLEDVFLDLIKEGGNL
jgi:ABC-type multidrug transport system ATPase subunit